MMVTAAASRPTNATTARSEAFLAAHLDEAHRLGTALADLSGDPAAFATALTDGLRDLADPAYLAGQRRVAPGIGALHGVRSPLLDAIRHAFETGTRDDRPTSLLFLADRLMAEAELEAHWFAFGILERTLAAETERTWQVLRRSARGAGDWITVDTLARAYAIGIAAEPYRWAELEQLVFSPSPWERRLVGSTIATMTHGRRHDRSPGGLPGERRAAARGDRDLADRALPLLANLMGDPEPDVQKALSWAYRSLAVVDPEATEAALRTEAALAVARDDGHRAWVVRDALSKLPEPAATSLRADLAGIRRRPGAPGTSAAGEVAARFGGLPDPARHPEPPFR